MTKHILPLTYEPKIAAVLLGKCTQTIRPFSTKPKRVNDLIMFHGWSGKPRHSKWSFRTPYWKINYVADVLITKNGIKKFNHHDIPVFLNHITCDRIAVLDGFSDYQMMYEQFVKMYGNEVGETVFQIIRWKYGKGTN